MADGKPWNYDRVLLTPVYDIIATLKLQRQLSEVQEKVGDLMREDYESKSKNKK